MLYNLFVYGSLVDRNEWNDSVSCEYQECIGTLTDSRYYLSWNVEVCTKLTSKFYQKGKSSMLSIARSNISNKNLNGVVYLNIKKIDIEKLFRREDYYDLIKIRVRLKNSNIIDAWTYKVRSEHIVHGLPKNKIYKSLVLKSYKSRCMNISQL